MSSASSPGLYIEGGIVLVDEPASAGATTFEADGTVLLTFNLREGGNVSQIIMGLSAHQVVQLATMLLTHQDALKAAIRSGKGGARWPEAEPEP